MKEQLPQPLGNADAQTRCPLTDFVNLISGKWAIPVLYQLIARDRPVRQRNETAGRDIVVDERTASEHHAEAANRGIESHLDPIDAQPVLDRRRRLRAARREPVAPIGRDRGDVDQRRARDQLRIRGGTEIGRASCRERVSDTV